MTRPMFEYINQRGRPRLRAGRALRELHKKRSVQGLEESGAVMVETLGTVVAQAMQGERAEWQEEKNQLVRALADTEGQRNRAILENARLKQGLGLKDSE